MPVGEFTANSKAIPRRAWMSGIVISFAMCGLVVLAFAMIGATPVITLLVPPVLVMFGAFAFSSIWPGRPWFWGVILSSGFWAYFLLVFIAYLSIKQWDGATLARALTALLAGMGGALAAARIQTARHAGRKRD